MAGNAASRGALQPGTVLNNNYRIIDRIGEGGMGQVYRAANIFMEEDHVAIKVIRAEQADDATFQQMFGKEVKAMLRLNNPRLVAYRTFAHDPELDLSFIVTEFIDGPSLKSLLGKRQFSSAELLGLMSELCIGLRAAHKAGIVHRDLAPDNVLLEDGEIERPKIIDFGIVKDTAGDGTTIIGSGFAGKYNFVAPEQLGEPDYPIGPWTDIYSLALVILGLASGRSIDMGNTPGAAIRMRREVPDVSCVAAPLRPLLCDMLATHPEQRIQSVEEVLERTGPIFTQLDGVTEPVAAEATIAPTVIAPEDSDDEGETVFVGTAGSTAAALAEEGFAELDNEDEEEEERSGGMLGWIFIGLLAAVGLAIFGGMMLGEYASESETDDGLVTTPPAATAGGGSGAQDGSTFMIPGEEWPGTGPQPSPTATATVPGPTPTISPTSSPVPTPTATTPTPTPTPTLTSPVPTLTPVPRPTATFTAIPVPRPTLTAVPTTRRTLAPPTRTRRSSER